MEFITKVDHGQKETFDKWNGKFLDETAYNDVVHSRGSGSDIIKVYKPHASLGERPLLAAIVKGHMKDRLDIKDTLFSIDDVSTMRANAAAATPEWLETGSTKMDTGCPPRGQRRQ